MKVYFRGLFFLLLYIAWALYFYFHPSPFPLETRSLCGKQSLPLNLQSLCSSLLTGRITGMSHQALLLSLYLKEFTFPC